MATVKEKYADKDLLLNALKSKSTDELNRHENEQKK